MRRPLALAVLLTLALPAVAHAAPPSGFGPVRVAAPGLSVREVAATAGAVAYLDDTGGIWATRVRGDGTLGSPLPVARGQREVRGLQVVVTERGETVVVWDAIASRTSGAVRYAVGGAPRDRLLRRTHPRDRRDRHERDATGCGAARRHRRRRVPRSGDAAAHRCPALRAACAGRHLRTRPLARPRRRGPPDRGGAGRRCAVGVGAGTGRPARAGGRVSGARRGAPPGGRIGRGGGVRSFGLAASSDGTAWVTWTRRDTTTTGFARRTRASNVGAVGPVQGLGSVAYGLPHLALGDAGEPLAAWNARGPGAQANVLLASHTRGARHPVREPVPGPPRGRVPAGTACGSPPERRAPA